MNTPGPATSLRTWSWPFPQNEQRVYRRRSSRSFIVTSSTWGLCPSRRRRRRGIMAPENLVRKAYALAADENSGPGDQPYPALARGLAAEGAFRLVPVDPAVLASASENHAEAPTFSFSRSFSPGFGGVRMMSSISPYSFAASDVRK